MKLLKTTALSGLVTFVKIAAGFISTKVVAVLIGASGVAMIGSFANFLSIILAFGNGGINTGVVKYTAEYDTDIEKTKELFSTALKISLWCSFFFGSILVIGSGFFAEIIFKSSSYWHIIAVLGITLVFYSLNSFIISILNGKSQIEKYTLVNTCGTFLGLIITCILVYYFKIFGAIYALILSQTLIFFISVILVVKQTWFDWSLFNGKLNLDFTRKLSRYTIMAVVTTLTVPVSQIILRNLLINNYGINNAGLWQGIIKISDGYLMVLNVALSTYYLPKLSSITNNIDLRKEIFNGYRLITPFVLLISIAVFVSRNYIISILYTSEFKAMEGLFMWQLFGDFFKIMAFVLAYLMLAKAMIRIYILTEVLFSVLYVFLGYFFVKKIGFEGVSLAFGLNYMLYFFTMVFLFRKIIFRKNTQEDFEIR